MQSTEGHNQALIPDVESTPRQPAAGYPDNDDWDSQSWSLGSDRSKAVDSQVHRYAETGERHYEPEFIPIERHILDNNNDSPDQDLLVHIADVNERRYGLFVKAQSANAAQRMEFHHQLDNFQYIMGRLRHSVGAFRSGIPGENTEPPWPTPKGSKARLTRLEGRLRTDTEELMDHIQSTMLVMSRLREGDQHVQETGDALHNSLLAFSTASRRNGFYQQDGGFMQTSVPLVSTPTSRSGYSNAARAPMADELARFCDAVGNFKIMRERIDELHLEKHEQEERRDFLGDQELKLDKRSERFLLGWHQSLVDAEKDYREAELAVKRAREVCEAAEISIPPWVEMDPAFDEVYQQNVDATQFATLSPPASIMLQELSGHVVESSTNSSEAVLINATSQMSNSLKVFDSLNNSTPSSDKVARWIEDVHPNVPEPSPENSSLSSCKANPSAIDAHHTVEQIRRMRSRRSLPSAARPRLLLKSTASSPSMIDAARNFEQTLEEIQPQVTPIITFTPVVNFNSRQHDNETTKLPPSS